MSKFMTPLVLPPRSDNFAAATPTPNTFFNQINDLSYGTTEERDSAIASSLLTPSLSAFKTPAIPTIETNPFDSSFGVGTSPDSTSEPLNGIQQLMGAVAAASIPLITRRSDSMSLLTAASEIELANQQTPITAPTIASNSVSTSPAQPMKRASTQKRKAAQTIQAAAVQHETPTKNAQSEAMLNASLKRSHSDDEDASSDSKREKFLARNRIAAQKCRRKRKERMDELQTTTTELQKANENLIKEISFLKDENYYVRTLLLDHRDCPVLQQNGMAQLLDSVTRPSIPNAIASAQLAPIISRTSSFS